MNRLTAITAAACPRSAFSRRVGRKLAGPNGSQWGV
jgi:hypothetical protein